MVWHTKYNVLKSDKQRANCHHKKWYDLCASRDYRNTEGRQRDSILDKNAGFYQSKTVNNQDTHSNKRLGSHPLESSLQCSIVIEMGCSKTSFHK